MKSNVGKKTYQSKLILEELESRQLFSGGIEGLIDTDLLSTNTVTYLQVDAEENQPSSEQSTEAAEARSHELVFVDTAVDDYQTQVDDLINNADSTRNFEVILLESEQNGIDVISQTLQEYEGLDAIHIISHGDDGNVQLGNTNLNAETLTKNNLNIALWATSFDEAGDILIYGCNLATTEVGESLINKLSELTLTDVAASNDLTDTAQVLAQQIVFLDTAVEDYETLMAGIDPNAEIVLLDTNRDGVEQIAEALEGRSGIDAIHLIAEGNAAELHLGDSFLTQESINNQYADLFTGIRANLSENADLLIYGCNFGQGAEGLQAVESLAALTGADIAASDDRTGHTSEYGDWVLEVNTGLIESSVVISKDAQSTWQEALSTYTVSNTNDSGAGSLRQAIIDANASAGTDNIFFDISDALVGGAHTISLLTELPDITETVVIDGTQDSDFAGTPVIVLDGIGVTGGGLRLTGIGSSDSTIRGLVIHSFSSDGIELTTNSDNNTIVGNYIGTDVTGTIDMGNGSGIRLALGTESNTIGGTTAADRNIISGNNRGIFVRSSSSNVISGNYIGTDFTGTQDLGNSSGGIDLNSGSADLNTIGGTAAGAGNIIAYNEHGIVINNADATGNAFLGNTIHSNTTLGIDLRGNGVTTNDADDIDTNANNLQNFPVITAAATTGSQIEISGTLDTDGLNQDYRIEFFASVTAHSTGHGEAERYLGFTTVTTNGSGDAVFTNIVIASAVSVGEYITATTTVDNGGGSYGDTSEFSQNLVSTALNNTPTLDSASLTLNEGDTVTLSAANFGITDPDDTSFTYTVSGVTGGYFQLSSNPGVSITSFSSADLSSSLVQFVDDDNEVAPSFSLTVNDGDIDSNTLAATINYTPVNDAPTLTATAADDSLTENTDTTSAAVFSTVTIDPVESGDDIISAQLTIGGGVENTDTLTINGTAITNLGSDSSGAIAGGHNYS
ncbi:MAG: DUF4347 domain-containing protein, partial [Gammaproteobacteria bacterium]|nr:DUF4347 domain-containing protein [Gammaproteobacteria bacterium]